jgi:hypothetical protein
MLKKFDQKVDVDEYLEGELEKKYMAILLSLVEGKIKSIGKTETEALVALRKEFIRRNVELNSLDKIIKNYEKALGRAED